MVHLPNGLNQCVYLFILFNYIIKEGACSFLNKLNLPLIFLLQPTKKIIFAFHLTYHIPSIFQETFHPESHSTITFIHQFDLLQKVFAGTQYKLFSPVTCQCKCAYGQIIQKSRVPFETGSALAHLGVIPRDLHKYTLQTMCQICSSVVLSWWPLLVLGWEREPPAAVSTL